MKNKHRKSTSSNGQLDNYAIAAEQLASYLTRRGKPPQVTLERIANLAEKAMNYQHMRTQRHGKLVPDNRPYLKEGRESQRNKVLDRIWAAYQIVQEEEIMHPYAQGKDESWNGAKEVNNNWKSEPTYYYGDHFDYVIGDEFHGNKAQGRTPIRDSNYNGDEGDDK